MGYLTSFGIFIGVFFVITYLSKLAGIENKTDQILRVVEAIEEKNDKKIREVRDMIADLKRTLFPHL